MKKEQRDMEREINISQTGVFCILLLVTASPDAIFSIWINEYEKPITVFMQALFLEMV